jgi:hypothetical protein
MSSSARKEGKRKRNIIGARRDSTPCDGAITSNNTDGSAAIIRYAFPLKLGDSPTIVKKAVYLDIIRMN